MPKEKQKYQYYLVLKQTPPDVWAAPCGKRAETECKTCASNVNGTFCSEIQVPIDCEKDMEVES